MKTCRRKLGLQIYIQKSKIRPTRLQKNNLRHAETEIFFAWETGKMLRVTTQLPANVWVDQQLVSFIHASVWTDNLHYTRFMNWIELNWIELNWIELNWTELNWIELLGDEKKSQFSFKLWNTGVLKSEVSYSFIHCHTVKKYEVYCYNYTFITSTINTCESPASRHGYF
jgi:hypothetical protein